MLDPQGENIHCFCEVPDGRQGAHWTAFLCRIRQVRISSVLFACVLRPDMQVLAEYMAQLFLSLTESSQGQMKLTSDVQMGK